MDSKLSCYAITPSAAQCLLGHDPRGALPPGWFCWTAPKGSAPGCYNAQRVEFLRDGTASTIERWNRNAVAAGLVPVLLTGLNEPAGPDEATGMDSETRLILVTPWEADAKEREALIDLLREPEAAVAAAWTDVMLGGGLQDVGFEAATLPQWCAYGEALTQWVRETAGTHTARRLTPDFSGWELLPGRVARSLVFARTWDIDHPLDANGALPADMLAYWPTKQLACCGIALMADGRLRCIGALPDDWSWDGNGEARKRFEAAKTRRMVRPREVESVLSRLLSFSDPHVAVARAGTTRAPKEPDPPVEVRWSEQRGDRVQEIVLVASGPSAQLRIQVLPPGATPTGVRLRADNSLWRVVAAGDLWEVPDMSHEELRTLINLFCDPDGDSFAKDGFEIVWEGE